MYKLANQVLDAYDDTSYDILKKIAQENPKINMMTPEELQSLEDSDFALSVITKKASKLNKFPINNYDNTFLSNKYFEETHNKLPKTAAEITAFNIKVACVINKITPTASIEKLAKDHGTRTYVEEDVKIPNRVANNPLEKFAKVKDITTNETFAKYAFATVEDVKTGAEYFNQYSDKMDVGSRHLYASALQKRASELGMKDLEGKVEKYAGSGYNAHVDAHVSSRKRLVDDRMKLAYDRLTACKNDVTPTEFANLMHGLDKTAGISKYYGSYLTNPFEATFARLTNPQYMYKAASGSIITGDDIQKLAMAKHAKIKEYLGVSIADALAAKGGSDIFESLPNDAKEIIVGIANGSI